MLVIAFCIVGALTVLSLFDLVSPGDTFVDLVRLALVVGAAATSWMWRTDRTRLESVTGQLQRVEATEESRIRLDPLTGLPNRAAFLESVEADVARCRRDGRAVCLGILGLDSFRAVNDAYGHAAGDELLQEVSWGIKETVRITDLVARVGGDEFGIVFWNVPRDNAEVLARRLQHRIARLGGKYDKAGVGARVGVAYFDAAPERVDDLMREVDKALAVARSSDDRIVVVAPQRVIDLGSPAASVTEPH